MNAILQFIKQKYETPLEMLHRLRRERPELALEKLSYLGRLDPLAHGVMLVAVGEANKEREKYLRLSKRYKASFLFGVSTDTGDLLGFIGDVDETVTEKDTQFFEHHILNLQGKHILPYPLYSSKTVNGKPLHAYSREGMHVEKPVREMEVVEVKIGEVCIVSGKEVAGQGVEATEKVKGGFRQNAIQEAWKKLEKGHREASFVLIEANLTVTSGTYIRSLAILLQEITGRPCIAYDIERVAFLNDLW